jgi:hypothetical protein
VKLVKTTKKVKAPKTDATEQKKSGAKLTPHFPVWGSALWRWGLVVLIVVMTFGRVSALNSARQQTSDLEREIAGWERTEADTRTELQRFSDPEWRENYWKWRTMTREPGEYYLRFYEDTTL